MDRVLLAIIAAASIATLLAAAYGLGLLIARRHHLVTLEEISLRVDRGPEPGHVAVWLTIKVRNTAGRPVYIKKIFVDDHTARDGPSPDSPVRLEPGQVYRATLLIYSGYGGDEWRPGTAHVVGIEYSVEGGGGHTVAVLKRV